MILGKSLIAFVNISRYDATYLNVKCYLPSLMHPKIAGWNNSHSVAYNDVRKHKNMSAGRRQIPSFSRSARAVYEPLASIAGGLTVSWRISSSLGEDDFLIQINAFSEITGKLVTCQPYLCAHRDFFVVSLGRSIILSRFNTKSSISLFKYFSHCLNIIAVFFCSENLISN